MNTNQVLIFVTYENPPQDLYVGCCIWKFEVSSV
jgi:hypothetical protein